MKRRDLLKTSGAVVAASAVLAVPSLVTAQESPATVNPSPFEVLGNEYMTDIIVSALNRPDGLSTNDYINVAPLHEWINGTGQSYSEDGMISGSFFLAYLHDAKLEKDAAELAVRFDPTRFEPNAMLPHVLDITAKLTAELALRHQRGEIFVFDTALGGYEARKEAHDNGNPFELHFPTAVPYTPRSYNLF